MDLEVLAGTLFIASQTVAAMKAFTFMRQIKMIKELMSKLNDDIFQPRTQDQRTTVASSLQFWWRLYVGYQIALGSTVVMWISFPLLDKSYKESRLPFVAWYPYDYTKSPLYEITYIYQSFSLVFLNVFNSNLDMFSVCLMICIGAQCDILCDNLKMLERSDEDYNGFNETLVDVIREHKEILTTDEKPN
ncbi:odorant receptor Or1-like [Zophobas morio]|uniref:odorant receptor Or1-like n=1 Tax=Zophobas morio TaxID=2755281 RepID=UPI0030828CFB